MRGLLLAGLAAFAFATPSWGDGPPTDDNSEWTQLEISSDTQQGSSSSGTATGRYSAPDTLRFFEELNRNLLDQICRNIDVNASQSFNIGDAGSAGIGIRRRLAMLPDRHIAIVDEKDLSLSPGHTFPLGQTGDASHSFWAGLQAKGTGLIVRETPAVKSCDEVLQLLNLPDYFKQTIIFPIKGKALMRMQVGEMWKIPVTFSLGASYGLSLPVVPAPAPGSVGVTLGGGQNGTGIMTVYRYVAKENGQDVEKLRFRLRLDHAWVFNGGASIGAGYKIGQLFSIGHGLIEKGFNELDHLLVREIESFLSASLGISYQRSNGQELVVEFILDPKNPDQMDKLADVMNGDFWTLAKMASSMLLHIDTPAHTVRDYIELVDKNRQTLGRSPTLTALDEYFRKSWGFPVNFPFFFRSNGGSGRGSDHIEFKDPPSVFKNNPDGHFHLAQADENVKRSYFNTPVGSYIKWASARSAQAFFHSDKDGDETDPQMVYIQQEGFVRRSGGKARGMAERVNGIMTMAGVRGGAPNYRYAIPLDLDRIQSLKPPPGQAPLPLPPPKLHDGMVALTIVFTERAVRDILSSAADLVMRCYANTLEGLERRIMDWLLEHGHLDSKGRLRYDEDAVFEKFGLNKNDFNLPKYLAEAAAGLVADIAAARNAPNKPARLEALVDLMAGKGAGGLAYEAVMKVLIQLVNPMDVTADLVVNMTKGKSLDNIRSHFVLSRGRDANPLLEAVGTARNLISQPSILVD